MLLITGIVFSTLILSLIAFPLPASAQQGPPKDLPDVSKAPFKVRVIEAGELRAEVRPLYTTFGNPNSYVTRSGGIYDGVGDLILTRVDFTVRCSGALLTDGIHVLTAAHCVTDDGGNLNLLSGNITFEGDTGDFQIAVVVSATKVHPDWDGDILRGNDVAVLKLDLEAPDEIPRYDIDRNAGNDYNDVNMGDKAGYGRSGNGDNGDVIPSGTKRDGQNKYDDVADTMLEALRFVPDVDFVPGSVLQYDFDNLEPENDAFGFFFGNTDLGLGRPEVNSAPGDSGGPTLTSDGITGITSYGVRLSTIFGSTSDVDDKLNSSFGEFSGDTRVSQHVTFIDGVLLTTPPSGPTPVIATTAPEPTNTTPIPFTVDFGEVVTGFDATDIAITGTATTGAIGSFTDTGSGTFSFNVPVTADGTVIVNIAGGAATDSLGNASQAAAQVTRTFDSTSPTTVLSVLVTSDFPTYTPKSFALITVEVTAGSPVSGASVSLKVTAPDGKVKTLSGTTDDFGEVTFKYRISPKAPLGEYTAIASASAAGFNPGTGSTTFTVS